MFQIEVACLVICIDNRYDYVQDLCAEYETSPNRPADIFISVSEEELCREMEKAPERFWSRGYGEGIVIYEKISNALPEYDAFVMHSSVIAVDGWAYGFAAESGKGKSTHTRYWKEVLGDRVTIINGDKPVYRFSDDRLMAYGTPWCGKENWQTNTAAPLKALCLLEQGKDNKIFPVDPFELLNEITHHFYLPGGGQVDMPKLIELIDRMLSAVPVYRLRCCEHVSAAETAAAYFGLQF